MSILITRSGVLNTLQDKGRHGFAKWGINPSGAMDQYAAQIANVMVGNDLNDAVVEMHFPSGGFLFEEDALISLAGC